MNNKTIIVEFNGLAGLGKTTVASKLKEDLIKDGYSVIGWYRRHIFQSLRPIFSIPYSFSLYTKMKRYAGSIEPYRKQRTYEHWANHFVRMYKSIEKHSNADFAISDEGIIQFIVAMGLNDHLPQSPLLEEVVVKIKSMDVSFIRVDCENNVEESYKRIKARPPKGMYYEEWPKNELLSQLYTESDNFDCLRAVFSKVYPEQVVITIDTLRPAEENARIIKDKIISIRNYDSF